MRRPIALTTSLLILGSVSLVGCSGGNSIEG